MKPLKFLSKIINSEIANSSKIFPFSRIINSKVSDNTYISYSCVINNCVIGKYCSIAQNVKVGLGIHPVNFISTSPVFYSLKNPLNINYSLKQKFQENKNVIIGNDVWIGTNVTILDGITIGDGSIIGANSLVVKDVEAYSIVGGVPAKLIRKRFSSEIIEKLILSKWWDLPREFFIQHSKIVELFSKPVEYENVLELLDRIKKFREN